MRVIANRDCYFTKLETREITNNKAIIKDSVYTVIGKKFHPGPHKFVDDPNYYPHGVWYYDLLEQTGYHCSVIFTELPEEAEVVELETELETENK